MCDVFFITPNTKRGCADEAIGTLQLATILEGKGIHCQVQPFYRIGQLADFENFLSSAVDMIEQAQPKIVSMYTRCDTYHIFLRLAERIKARWSDKYVVFGGPQSDITAEDTIALIPYVDFVCCGEGETTIYPFFSSLMKDQPDYSVAGLVYRQNGQVIKNPRPELIKDLDILPLIDYSMIQIAGSAEEPSSIRFPIDVGRGCPFGCTYCSTKAFWGRKYRVKSPQRIFDEIKALHDQYGITKFKFSHDMFTFNHKTVTETCRLLKTLDFPIDWTCSGRLDSLDPEIIDIMADSGLTGIFIGIETGSPRMQKLINKNLNLSTAISTLSYLKEKGIRMTLSFIYGFPEETEEDLSQTMSLIAQILQHQFGHVITYLCTFLEKTELSERYFSQMTRTTTYTNVTGCFAIEECEDLISQYPSLFTHMMEYKTELRTKLKHFERFFEVWSQVQPVYQYISEKYPQDRLIDMYYDFVEANRDVLAEIEDMPFSKKAYAYLVRNDRLPERFADDPNYDLMKDCRRMRITETSDEVQEGGNVTEVYCFDPKERKRPGFLQNYQRCVAVVNYNNRRVSVRKVPLQK